jgi:hypothetical protein
MKYRVICALAAAALVPLGLSSSAQAQPRPEPPTGVRPTAPYTGHRPPMGEDPHDARRDAHEEHKGAADNRETEEQLRMRMQKQHEAELAQRRIARRDAKAWASNRSQRDADARAQIGSTWGDLAQRPEGRAELATHAERMAQLNRILDVAQDKGDAALVAHTKLVMQHEIARDARVLQSLRGMK